MFKMKMKTSRKIGAHAFYLQFFLIIVLVIAELSSAFFNFINRLAAWKIILTSSSVLLSIVWGGIATKNFKKNITYNQITGNGTGIGEDK